MLCCMRVNVCVCMHTCGCVDVNVCTAMTRNAAWIPPNHIAAQSQHEDLVRRVPAQRQEVP